MKKIKNKFADLNNHLFSQLEKLDDDDLTGEELEGEIKRSEAITKLSTQILQIGNLELQVIKHMDEYGYERQKAIPELFEVVDEE